MVAASRTPGTNTQSAPASRNALPRSIAMPSRVSGAPSRAEKPSVRALITMRTPALVAA